MADVYEIVRAAPRTRAEPGGAFTQVQLVTFRTKPSGYIGTLEVPDAAFTPEEVDRLVREKTAVLEAVAHL